MPDFSADRPTEAVQPYFTTRRQGNILIITATSALNEDLTDENTEYSQIHAMLTQTLAAQKVDSSAKTIIDLSALTDDFRIATSLFQFRAIRKDALAIVPPRAPRGEEFNSFQLTAMDQLFTLYSRVEDAIAGLEGHTP